MVTGKGTPGTGVAWVEVYDLAAGVASKLGDISTRAFVNTGSDVVIAGFILGSSIGNDNVIVRGLGPSLSGSGLSPVLADPTLDLFNSSGTIIQSNDNWQTGPNAAEINALGLAPTNPLESAMLANLPPVCRLWHGAVEAQNRGSGRKRGQENILAQGRQGRVEKGAWRGRSGLS